MTSFKRAIAKSLGQLFDVHIIPGKRVGPWIERNYLANMLRELSIDCVFDVGANKGQHGKLLRDAGYRGLIISFEPNPTAFAVLEAVASKDRLWHTVQIGLGSEEGQIPFNVMKSDDFSSFKEPSEAEDGRFGESNQIDRTILVEVRKLDGELKRLRSTFGFVAPFLKMDTQGFDLEVVRGAGDSIHAFTGLSSEIAIQRIYKDSPTMTDSIKTVNALGFDFVNFLPVHPENLIDPLEFNSYAVNRGGVRL